MGEYNHRLTITTLSELIGDYVSVGIYKSSDDDDDYCLTKPWANEMGKVVDFFFNYYVYRASYTLL